MYKFYVETYAGSIIPNVTEFKRVLREANAFVDTLVLCRDNLIHRQIEEKYKSAVCAVAEVLYRQNSDRQVQSESVGNHSVSFKVKTQSDYESEMRRKAMLYLSGTGLCYGGIKRW